MKITLNFNCGYVFMSLTGSHKELESDSDKDTLPKLNVGDVSPGV